jgi:hypothetical protein
MNKIKKGDWVHIYKAYPRGVTYPEELQRITAKVFLINYQHGFLRFGETEDGFIAHIKQCRKLKNPSTYKRLIWDFDKLKWIDWRKRRNSS